jgi:hypothetical protein
MANYSNVLTQAWLKSIIKFNPDEEVKEEAGYLLKMFNSDAHKQHKKYMVEFIDTNKLETVKNMPNQIN